VVVKVRELYKVEFADGLKGALGMDEHGRLYWNGQPVVTAQRVLLSWWINLAVVVGGLSMLAIALFNFLAYLNTLPA
jgi:hypothetical protein